MGASQPASLIRSCSTTADGGSKANAEASPAARLPLLRISMTGSTLGRRKTSSAVRLTVPHDRGQVATIFLLSISGSPDLGPKSAAAPPLRLAFDRNVTALRAALSGLKDILYLLDLRIT